MNRAERRRQRKADQKSPAKYTFTKEYLRSEVEKAVKEKIQKEKDAITNNEINQDMLILFVLPMEVLMDHYWKKSYAKKIPEFTEHLLEYYESWQNGELDMDKMKQDLWEYGGIRIEESD